MKRIAIPFLCGALWLLATTVASAATFRVDDTADAVDASPGDGICATAGGTCTLRAAVQEANALAGADRIRLRKGSYALQIGGGGEDDAATGDLDVKGRLRVVGRGAADTIVDGASLDRVFDVQANARVVFRRLAIRRGKPGDPNAGGGINGASGSRLTLRRVRIEGNEAFSGGGLATLGELAMTESMVLDNVAAVGGGLALTAPAVIDASTVAGNTATGSSIFGGHDVVAAGEGTISIVNSTITGEIQGIAYCHPYPIACTQGADFVLRNVTANVLSAKVIEPIAGPSSPVTLHLPTFTIRNTIVGGCDAELISQGYNFVQPEGCTILGDLTGVVVGDDPLLGSLRDNGGPTLTRLPVAVSAAVDGGNPATPGSGGFACEPFDQRGMARFLGMSCDIGAVEGH